MIVITLLYIIHVGGQIRNMILRTILTITCPVLTTTQYWRKARIIFTQLDNSIILLIYNKGLYICA